MSQQLVVMPALSQQLVLIRTVVLAWLEGLGPAGAFVVVLCVGRGSRDEPW